MARGEMSLDIAAARRDILAAGDELVTEPPEVGAVVLECTNMVPFARALGQLVIEFVKRALELRGRRSALMKVAESGVSRAEPVAQCYEIVRKTRAINTRPHGRKHWTASPGSPATIASL